MSDALPSLSPRGGEVSTELAGDAERARAFAAEARAANTRRAYRSDWADFCAWCDARGVSALPATTEVVSLYIASRAEVGPPDADGAPTAGLKVSTLQRRLAAINGVHRAAGHPAPANRREEPLHSVWAGLVRTKGLAVEKVAPALPDDLRVMVEALPRTEAGDLTFRSKRDKALLLLGFAGALRRSELVAVEVAHLGFTADGIRLAIPRSKADQAGQGAVLGIAYGSSPTTCPVRAVRSWVQAMSEQAGAPASGPLFRKVDRWGCLGRRALTPGSVAKLVKQRARAAGLDPALYAGHSLRGGMITAAARAGKAERDIMQHSRHKTERVLRGYIHEGALFSDNPTEGIGL